MGELRIMARQHLLKVKGSEYEGGVRVPFIVAWAHPDAENKFQKAFPVAQMPYRHRWGQ